MKRYVLLLPIVVPGCDCGGSPPHSEENLRPDVTIVSPQDGAELPHIGPYLLQGSAVDPEDGALSGARLVWSSDVDGPLGTGESVSASLSPGPHVITLQATDSQGAMGLASAGIVVRAGNLAPTAIITSPAPNALFVEGEAITLVGRGMDPEDGELGGASLYWSSSVDGGLGTGTSVTWNAPSLGQHQVLLTAIDGEGAEGLATITVTVLPLGSNFPPTVTIDMPQDGANFAVGDWIDFAGTAVDPEDGSLDGARLVWTSSADGVLGQGVAIGRNDLSPGFHAITLEATDANGDTGRATIGITVNPMGNDPPVVAITSPGQGSVHFAGAVISFMATASDAEDGTLPVSSIMWSSSLDGFLGTGSPLGVSTLRVGGHRITASVTDGGGSVGFASIELTVLASNEPPVVAITSPADGSAFTAGTTIALRGMASDPEDGALAGAALTWRSHLDGVLGSGVSLDFASLSPGMHVLTLSAVDSGGRMGSAGVQVRIEPAMTNVPPIALLGAPQDAFAGDPVTLTASASSDADGMIVDYRFDFGDATPAASTTSPGITHIYAAPGVYTVTLTVTDNDGATAQAMATIEILEPVRVPVVVSDVADSLGTACDIAVDAGDAPQVVYRNNTHPGVWYARYRNNIWTRELIEGQGFDTGGSVAGQMSLAIDSSGAPHVAYLLQVGNAYQVHYATLSGTTWIIERVDMLYPYFSVAPEPDVVAIALDDSRGGRPTVAYTTSTASGQEAVVIAYRTGVNTWTNELGPENDHEFAGGLVMTGMGSAFYTARNDIGGQELWAGEWQPGTFVEAQVPMTVATTGARIVLYGAAEPVIVTQDGVAHRMNGAWVLSEIENASLSSFDIAARGAAIWTVYRHGTGVEIASAASGGYWERTYQGPMDGAQPGIAVDSSDEPRVCFFRNGNLLVY